ncbi:MAG: ribonuclease P protein component [Bacteroidales bacterium]|nr:ribonuclease P protein component [Bacteroidales bacterium]
MNRTFPKSEHLYGIKTIERLYNQGSVFVSYPFRVVYFMVEDKTESVPVRAMVSVSKRKFKNAVDRNRIKRLMRETYRLNKSRLIEFIRENDLNVHLAFQYISDEIISFAEMNSKMEKALDKLIKIISVKVKNIDEIG